MSGSFDAPIAKLNRAVQHYRTLKEMHGGFDRKRRAVTFEAEPDGLQYRFYIGQVEPLHPDFAFVLGDALHNVRAALDYLAFQLHVRHFRGQVPDDVVEASMFPIHDPPWRYRNGRKKGQLVPSSEWNAIRRLGPRDRAAIEWLQPDHRWDGRGNPRQEIHRYRKILEDVHRLDIVDKHREAHLVRAVLMAVAQPRHLADYGFRQNPRFGVALESNAKVDTWTFAIRPPAPNMQTHIGVLTAVGIEPSEGDRIEVLPYLGGLIVGVSRILYRFANRFPPVLPFDITDLDVTEEPPLTA